MDMMCKKDVLGPTSNVSVVSMHPGWARTEGLITQYPTFYEKVGLVFVFVPVCRLLLGTNARTHRLPSIVLRPWLVAHHAGATTATPRDITHVSYVCSFNVCCFCCRVKRVNVCMFYHV